MYNLTLLKSHYTQVVVELSNGYICGLKYDETNTLCCVWKDCWDRPDGSKMCAEIDIDTAYNQMAYTNRNIVKCSILSTSKMVDECVRTQTMPYAWDFDNSTNHLKFKKGDNVIIKSTEYRKSYKCALECVGTIVDAEHIDDERITYRVRIDGLDNKCQVDGLWVFHEEKSLELCTATNMNKLYKTIDHPIYMPCEPTPYQLYKPNGIELYNNYILYENGTWFSKQSNKFLKPFINSSGYERVALYTPLGRKLVFTHIKVIQYFGDCFGKFLPKQSWNIKRIRSFNRP